MPETSPKHGAAILRDMDISDLDRLDDDGARTVVAAWADVPRWVGAVLDARPYDSVDDLAATADRLARTWTDDEVAAALADHPRIGERHAGTGASAAASRVEQSSSADADAATTEALRVGNAAYEARFDRVFLVRAAGRSAAEILTELERRLENDDAAERAEVADELRAIALLRLERTFA